MRTWLMDLYLGDDWQHPLPSDLLELIFVMAGLFRRGRSSSSFVLFHTPKIYRRPKTKRYGPTHQEESRS